MIFGVGKSIMYIIIIICIYSQLSQASKRQCSSQPSTSETPRLGRQRQYESAAYVLEPEESEPEEPEPEKPEPANCNLINIYFIFHFKI